MTQNTGGQQNAGQSKWDQAAASGKTITIPANASTLAQKLQDAGVAEEVTFSGNQPTDTSRSIRMRFTTQASGQMNQYAHELEQAGVQISDDTDTSMGTASKQ